jgi:hypothetical protein
MWSITSDGSVVDTQQKVIAFSRERFIADICLGECCFICGAAPGTRPFNNEHIVPRWMLREYDLFSRTLSLPNGTTVRYDQYNIPCCQQCNDDLSRQFEIPISAAVKKGFNGVADYLQHHGLNLFAWMGLIFLKNPPQGCEASRRPRSASRRRIDLRKVRVPMGKHPAPA